MIASMFLRKGIHHSLAALQILGFLEIPAVVNPHISLDLFLFLLIFTRDIFPIGF